MIAKDETFTFLSRNYHIGKLWDLLKDDNTLYQEDVLTVKNLEDLSKFFGGIKHVEDGKTYFSMGVRINQEHADSLTEEDLLTPGIWIFDKTKDENFSLLIDGWHRAYRCWKEKKEFKVLVIDNQDLIRKIIF